MTSYANCSILISGYEKRQLNRAQHDLFRKAKKIVGEAQTSFVNGEYEPAIEKGNQAVRILNTIKDMQ